jgi:hypothetical protein
VAEADGVGERPSLALRLKMRLLLALLTPMGWVLHRVDRSFVPKQVPHPSAPMPEADLNRLIQGQYSYHPYLAQGQADQAPDSLVDDSMMLHEWARKDPERLWPVLVELLERSPNHETLMWLAAGDLEDLVSWHGSRFLDRLERQAIVSKNFHEALRGIWGWQRLPKHVRERLFSVLTPEWEQLADRRAALT